MKALKRIEENAAAIAAVRAEAEEVLQARDRLIWQAAHANTPRARIMEAADLGNRAVGAVLEKDPDRVWHSRKP
ncbi:hypothetical protein QP992_11355 [Corynebacterium ulcerans]|uniref:hypothetical protein n=1 Tax=Corynebacterium ulcerans TaxID=65058 RepID=UPI0018D76C21|nr:hypothetical protein [Corynebacterium ulcerans]MBH5296964.1 hypothetical protein [Corynebacterium ulcerans]MDK8889743.1 hypothetical protein [Corynebacterium ulcerans]